MPAFRVLERRVPIEVFASSAGCCECVSEEDSIGNDVASVGVATQSGRLRLPLFTVSV